jgi:nitronate monooxygenase
MTSRLPPLFDGLTLPVIAAPMFLVSHPELVIAECQAGLVGTFPALNARPSSQLRDWIGDIRNAVGGRPFGVNLIVHPTNTRLEDDLAICVEMRVPLVITSVGKPGKVVDAVHGYGGIVFHDVTNALHARKAVEAGVDGLILVAAGAGGHGGTLSPFALIEDVRAFYDGPVVLAGAITRGNHIRAALTMGADLAYIGTRLIATAEAHASEGYKQMLVASSSADIMYTPAFTGIPGNYLRPSIVAAGLDPNALVGKEKPDLELESRTKAWRDIWGAGQGLAAITDVPTVAELVARLKQEYEVA